MPPPVGVERLNDDDMATQREAEFLAAAQLRQSQRAAELASTPGVCTNCDRACLPLAVYCDEDCRADHEQRSQRQARLRKKLG